MIRRLIAWLISPEVRRLRRTTDVAWVVATKATTEAAVLTADNETLRDATNSLRTALIGALGERDHVTAERDQLAADLDKLREELAELEGAPDDPRSVKYWRRRSDQDRRNAVLLEDRLAAATGRVGSAPARPWMTGFAWAEPRLPDVGPS